MRPKSQKINVHRLLHELFGRETTYRDISAILIGGVILTVTTQLLCFESELTTLKKVILTIMTLDIGGGVVANFTEGTNNYYLENIYKRYLFILIHILQPIILLWVFPNNLYPILTTTLFTLIGAVTVTSVREKVSQRNLSILVWLMGISLTYLLSFSMPVIQLIIIVYSTKLIVAFSVNWENSNN